MSNANTALDRAVFHPEAYRWSLGIMIALQMPGMLLWHASTRLHFNDPSVTLPTSLLISERV